MTYVKLEKPFIEDRGRAAKQLIAFGLAKSTALRLVGLPHVTPDAVARWLSHCYMHDKSNAFLIIRLRRNDIPPPERLALSAEASARIKAMMTLQRQQPVTPS